MIFQAVIRSCVRCQGCCNVKNAVFLSKRLYGGGIRNVYNGRKLCVSRLGLVNAKRVYATLGVPLVKDLSPFARRCVGYWLLGCCGMVFGAVVLGGVTRLTESGLSMVDWHLIKGIKPPVTEEEWEIKFEQYKLYPEFKHKSLIGGEEMTMGEFKFIWTMEYLHRMWGRLIGVAFLGPAAFFWYKGWFTKPMKSRMTLAAGLLIFQGLLGWYMVKSGPNPKSNSNENIPRVSQYRLAAHLSSAFILYTILLWYGLSHVLTPHNVNQLTGIGKLRGLAHFSKSAMFLTAVVGAFVAGLDAGLVYNSWPKFADRWIPSDLWLERLGWKNFTEHPTMVQFIHRGLTYVTLAGITTTWLIGWRMPLPPRTKIVLNSLAVMTYFQVMLGVATLIYYVPVWLGALHQSGSLVSLTFAFWLTNEIRRFPVK